MDADCKNDDFDDNGNFNMIVTMIATRMAIIVKYIVI